ncbi:MAG: uroporphyrinogen decarboxylase family protein [Verrucomicrobiae bacterium]|nr:uroporphyrinogen decarboxylase family protein [Verrucomicrobiae bacterium]
MNPFQFNPGSERIQTACKRLADAYARKPQEVVPVVENGGFRSPYSVKERFDDLDKMLDHSVKYANFLASTDNDWPPYLDTYCTVTMVPEAFGCEIVLREGYDLAAHPAIHDIEKVWTLKPRRMEETPTIRRLFEWIDHAQKKLGTEVPFWTADIQSPFSVAAQIVDAQELFAACIEAPKTVHHLCRMITDYSIEFMRKHLAQMENAAFPGRNFPSIPGLSGICIADDTPLVMLNPRMYREFAFPYNAELGRAFGGIYLHSCGNYRCNLDNLLDLPDLRAIQVHAGPGEFPLPASAAEDDPFNRARQKAACFVDANDVTRGDRYKDRPKAHYEEYVLPRLKQGDMTGIILQSCGIGGDIPDVETALRWTRSRLQPGRKGGG